MEKENKRMATKQEKLKKLAEHMQSIQDIYDDLATDINIEESMFEDAQENEQLREENERLRKEIEELKKNQAPVKASKETQKNLNDATTIIHKFSVWFSRIRNVSDFENLLFKKYGLELMSDAHDFLWRFNLDEIVPWHDTEAGKWRNEMVRETIDERLSQKTIEETISAKPTTKDQKFYKVDGQLKAEIDVYQTKEQDGEDNTPPISECRHAILPLNNKGKGYATYDRLLCRIVNGVFYDSLEGALQSAQNYNEWDESPQDMIPNGKALGLKYPAKKT